MISRDFEAFVFFQLVVASEEAAIKTESRIKVPVKQYHDSELKVK